MKKYPKLFAALSCAAMLTAASVPCSFAFAEENVPALDEGANLRGDVVGSDGVTNKDALAIQMHMLGLAPLGEEQLFPADTNCDESVNLADAINVMQWNVKQNKESHVGEYYGEGNEFIDNFVSAENGRNFSCKFGSAFAGNFKLRIRYKNTGEPVEYHVRVNNSEDYVPVRFETAEEIAEAVCIVSSDSPTVYIEAVEQSDASAVTVIGSDVCRTVNAADETVKSTVEPPVSPPDDLTPVTDEAEKAELTKKTVGLWEKTCLSSAQFLYIYEDGSYAVYPNGQGALAEGMLDFFSKTDENGETIKGITFVCKDAACNFILGESGELIDSSGNGLSYVRSSKNTKATYTPDGMDTCRTIRTRGLWKRTKASDSAAYEYLLMDGRNCTLLDKDMVPVGEAVISGSERGSAESFNTADLYTIYSTTDSKMTAIASFAFETRTRIAMTDNGEVFERVTADISGTALGDTDYSGVYTSGEMTFTLERADRYGYDFYMTIGGAEAEVGGRCGYSEKRGGLPVSVLLREKPCAFDGTLSFDEDGNASLEIVYSAIGEYKTGSVYTFQKAQ